MPTPRFAFRATADDLAQLDDIAEMLRRSGVKYPSRAAALRHALQRTVRAEAGGGEPDTIGAPSISAGAIAAGAAQ